MYDVLRCTGTVGGIILRYIREGFMGSYTLWGSIFAHSVQYVLYYYEKW